jgi:hypothetical protein
MSVTLRQIREESGLKLREVLDRMRQVEPGAPKSHTGLIHIETRGTDRLPLIKALAYAYRRPVEEIEEACRQKKCTN